MPQDSHKFDVAGCFVGLTIGVVPGAIVGAIIFGLLVADGGYNNGPILLISGAFLVAVDVTIGLWLGSFSHRNGEALAAKTPRASTDWLDDTSPGIGPWREAEAAAVGGDGRRDRRRLLTGV